MNMATAQIELSFLLVPPPNLSPFSNYYQIPDSGSLLTDRNYINEEYI